MLKLSGNNRSRQLSYVLHVDYSGYYAPAYHNLKISLVV
jgi:hypothetical protein